MLHSKKKQLRAPETLNEVFKVFFKEKSMLPSKNYILELFLPNGIFS